MADQPTDPIEQDPNADDQPSSGADPESSGEQAESDAQGTGPGSDPDPPDSAADERGESSSSAEAPSAPAMSDAAASLLAAAKAAVSKASAPQQPQPADDPVASSRSQSGADGVEMSNDDIAAMMAQAEQESQAAPRASGGSSADGATPFEPPVLDIDTGASEPGGIDLLAEVHLDVQIELGRTRMLIEDVLSLGDGAVVELDKLAGDPVDVYVNNRLIARGEVLVLNDNFCVRISEICDAEAAAARSHSA